MPQYKIYIKFNPMLNIYYSESISLLDKRYRADKKISTLTTIGAAHENIQRQGFWRTW
jgi:hypothetical protein